MIVDETTRVSGAPPAFVRKPEERIERATERAWRMFFAACVAVVVGMTALIFFYVFYQALAGALEYGVSRFIVAAGEGVDRAFAWRPYENPPQLSIVPLVVGTATTAVPATLVAAALGLLAGGYLSEVAHPSVKNYVRPAVELFAAVPTVVLGFIAATIAATVAQELFDPSNRLNAFVASMGVALVVVPSIASMTEEALDSPPPELREASRAMGATRWTTATRVVVPAAGRDVVAAVLIGLSRALGETMIVLMATGNAPNVTANLFKSVRTMTATVAAETGAGLSEGSEHFAALFAVGALLLIATFTLNVVAEVLLRLTTKERAASTRYR
jgi:phosphate transport system permease protein